MFVVPSLFVVLSVARRKRRPYSGPHLVARLVRGASCALGLRLGRTAPRAPRGTIPAPSALSCAVLCLASHFVSFALLPFRPSQVLRACGRAVFSVRFPVLCLALPSHSLDRYPAR